MKGLIFDFNGTMFHDSYQNRKAWKTISQSYRGTPFSEDELFMLNGRTNPATVQYMLGYVPDNELQRQISKEKEALYVQYCLKNPQKLHLAVGLEQLLDTCKQRSIPIAIASSCGASNMERYIQWFDLHRWFSDDVIIFDRGNFPGKPDPTIYREAAKALHLQPADCVVFEDTKSGIQSAQRAGIGEIWAVASEGADVPTISNMDNVVSVLKDFNEYMKNGLPD